ncbi:MAG: PIN domain-containing protein [Trueperaceae bacterium]|nr:PIN domain-containing protein [Trueperaceae bacterium]
MRSILVDAGPLIALFDRDDAHHDAIRDLLRRASGRLITTWPVLTETSHLLVFDVRAQVDFYGWVADGGVLVHDLPVAALERITGLVEKDRDRPMDLADATLVVAAETLGITEIISIDRDLDIDRTADRAWFVNLCTARA